MFAIPTTVGVSQRVAATLVATAVLLSSIGMYSIAEAANLTNVSNTLTDSDLSALSGHDIRFTVPTGSSIAPANTIAITFPAGFTGVAGSVVGNLTVTVNAGAASPLAFDSTGQVISFNNITATAGQEVRVVIAPGVITNPGVTDSYEFVINTGNGDTGKTRVAILDNVLVTAIVNTVFDFTVSGLATSTAVNGTSTTGLSFADALPFGTLTAGQIETLGQRLNVTTNARNGFIVTVESDGDFESSNGAIIDVFDEGVGVYDTGTAWNSPVTDVNDPTSWGHWGLTPGDGDLNSLGGYYSGEFTGNNYMAASTSPMVIFHHDGPSDGVTTNIGSTTIAYQVEITPLQEAADDYNTTLTYIATPTF